MLELSVGRKTDNAREERNNYRRVPKWERKAVLKGKGWSYTETKTDH